MFAFSLLLAAGRFELLLDRFHVMLQQPHTGLMLRSFFLLASASAGIYLMLPRGGRPGRRLERCLGGALATFALVLLVTIPISTGSPIATGDDMNALPPQSSVADSQMTVFWSLGDQPRAACWTFQLLAFFSLASAVMMITSRSPVYSALWFALVLLANSGLYLLQGAEFLSAATIIVYAGAIVVTFLFVIMLAQPNGAARYDRVSREPFLSSLTGLVLAAALVGTLHHAARLEVRGGVVESTVLPAPEIIAAAASLPDNRDRLDAQGHVVDLGRALFLDHAASVEVIGLLLLAAVVGAMLIAGHRVEHH
jgi:NADH-quinone oxidoreductase subunit J